MKDTCGGHCDYQPQWSLRWLVGIIGYSSQLRFSLLCTIALVHCYGYCGDDV